LPLLKKHDEIVIQKKRNQKNHYSAKGYFALFMPKIIFSLNRVQPKETTGYFSLFICFLTFKNRRKELGKMGKS
jgi:hypothetical protein